MREKNELDILIPVFNEDKTIVKTIKLLNKICKFLLLGYDLELLILS